MERDRERESSGNIVKVKPPDDSTGEADDELADVKLELNAICLCHGCMNTCITTIGCSM